jgi:hypothetical protein
MQNTESWQGVGASNDAERWQLQDASPVSPTSVNSLTQGIRALPCVRRKLLHSTMLPQRGVS